MSNAVVTVTATDLELFLGAALRYLGAPSEDAEEAARHLVDSDLCGYESHGAVRLLEYSAAFESRSVLESRNAPTLIERGGTLLVDGKDCLGAAVTARVVDRAITKALDVGHSIAAVRHVEHIGRLGYYAERAAAARMILFMTVGALGADIGITVLPGTLIRFAGGNPWCFGFPGAAGKAPVVVDISSCAIAEGKVRIAAKSGHSLPMGMIVDKDGQLSDNPRDFYAGGGILPVGGPAVHKGVGLTIASALMGALSMIDDDNPSLTGAKVVGNGSAHVAAGLTMILVDPGAFGPSEHYCDIVDSCLSELADVARERGAPFIVPGQRAAAARTTRARDGVPMSVQVFDDLCRWASTRGLPELSCGRSQ
jgi:hydroxycarboxylate dehydrogenase B